MSPLDIARTAHTIPTAHGILSIIAYPDGTWRAVCDYPQAWYRREDDEDGRWIICDWVDTGGPIRDRMELAYDDACAHAHHYGARCWKCEACRAGTALEDNDA